MSALTVKVYPFDEAVAEPLTFNGITSVTLIDGNSHGQAALGGPVASGNKRLLVCSPHVVAVEIGRE